MGADDYLALGETLERYELVNGLVVRWPSPTPLHQQLIAAVLLQIGRAEDAGLPIIALPSTDVRFDATTVYCPDVLVYRAEELELTDEPLTSPPLLVVEVVSAWNRSFDLITKRDDYDRFGVMEYWMIDAEDGFFDRWARREGKFIEVPPGAGDGEVGQERVGAVSLEGLVLDLQPIREMIRLARQENQ